MNTTQVLLFIPAALAVAISPGANNLLAFSNGGRQGLLPAVIALSGRCLAFAMMIALVIVGLGAILEASELAFQIIKWGGVIYLAYLGVTMMMARSPQQGAGSPPVQSAGALAKREFIVAITNPKAVLLFTAFVPQFVVPTADDSFSMQLIVLGTLYIAIECLAAIAWAWAGSLIRTLQPSANRMLQLNRITGALMLAASGALAATKRSA